MVDNYFRKKSLTYANNIPTLDVNKRKSFNIYASSSSAKTAESLISKKKIINFILIKMKSQWNLSKIIFFIRSG